MKRILFILFIILAVAFISIKAYAQNVYSNAINSANAVRNQTEDKVQEETESITTSTSTPTSTGAQNQVQTQEATQNIGEDYRLRVSNVVQNLTQIAEQLTTQNPQLGEQLKTMTQEQTQSMERIASSLDKIQNRNSVVRFLIGANYGEIKNVKAEIEQNRLRIQELNQIMNQLQNEGDKTTLQEQIQTLELENTSLEEALKEAQGGFSLFGWLVSLFYR